MIYKKVECVCEREGGERERERVLKSGRNRKRVS